MAIDYFFEFDTEKSPQFFLENTARCFSFDWVGENLTGSGLLIAAGDLSDLGLSYSQDVLGISPTVSVLFNFDKFEYTEEIYRLMIRICADWITRESGDALLQMSAAGLLFLRKSGVLAIDTDRFSSWWKPERLALMPEPWKRGKLPAY